MPLVQTIGQKVTHTISNRALGTMDAYPGVVADIIEAFNPTNGQPSPIATIIVERMNLAGEAYLASADVPVRFLLPRYARVESVDGTVEAPKSVESLVEEFAGNRLAFITAQAKAQGVDELAAELAAAPAVD